MCDVPHHRVHHCITPESDPAQSTLVNFEGDKAGAAARKIVAQLLAGESARAAE
jgi:hypothetical protein